MEIVDLTPEEFKAKIENPEVIVVDVRTDDEVDEVALKYDMHTNVLDTGQFLEDIEDIDTEKEYAVYCRSGKRSLTASRVLVDKGVTKIGHLEGGILAYIDEIGVE